MSVVVSYNRQFLLALIFAFILLLAIEGTLRTFEWIYPGCVMVDSESQQFVDIFKLRQMCLDVQQLNFQQQKGFRQKNINKQNEFPTRKMNVRQKMNFQPKH